MVDQRKKNANIEWTKFTCKVLKQNSGTPVIIMNPFTFQPSQDH